MQGRRGWGGQEGGGEVMLGSGKGHPTHAPPPPSPVSVTRPWMPLAGGPPPPRPSESTRGPCTDGGGRGTELGVWVEQDCVCGDVGSLRSEWVSGLVGGVSEEGVFQPEKSDCQWDSFTLIYTAIHL